MSGEAGVVVQRRDRAEIARIASLYRASGLGRSEFCRRHGMALSTLNRHLQKQFQDVDHPDNDGVRRSPLVEVKLAASVNPMRSVDRRCALTLLLDRKSTRLNSSHLVISYAVFCLKKTHRTDRGCPAGARAQSFARLAPGLRTRRRRARAAAGPVPELVRRDRTDF